ncbi:MAG: gamma-glutamyl kinase [Pseudoruegeria sp.]
MLIFHKQKLVLLSVPKTGTTSLQTALESKADIVVKDPPGLKHLSFRGYQRLFEPMLKKHCEGPFETVAVIREPIDWMASWYKYRSRPFLNNSPNSTKSIDFDTFIRAYLSDDVPAYAKIGSQSNFAAAKDGSPGVTHRFRYESMDEICAFLRARLSLDFELPVLNKSPARELSLSSDVETLFRETNSKDFDLWENAKTKSV